ncbi:MAG: hypothetical protein LCH69_17285 [Proteobacteria bacterium]|nr:hypothetical protein [Pseudomonadota bacterium]
MSEDSKTGEDRIEERLARITGGVPAKRKGVSPWLIGASGGAIGLAAGIYVMAVAPALKNNATPVETSTVAEFGSGANGLDGFMVRPETPEVPRKLVTGPSPEVEKLQTLVDSLNQKIAEMERNPKTVAVADDAALKDLRDQLGEIQGQLSGKDKALADAKTKSDELERQLMQLQGQLDTERMMADQKTADETARANEEAELARRRQAAEEQRQAQIHAPMVAWRAGGGAGAGGGGSGGTAGEAQDKYIGADGFIRASAKPVDTKQASVIANPSHTIMQGTLIEAALETAINSDLPGAVAAVVTNDVWSFDMSQVLIPRGSKLFGRYDSDVGVGQKRILIAWNRVVTTDGQSVDLAAYGTDGLGRSGLPARVRSHFLEKFGSATLLSVIGAIPDFASSEGSNDTGVSIIKDMGGNMKGATDSAIGDYLDIPPTLSTDQGAVVMVRVDSDLEFY